ncbi:hypothetical protein LWC35_22665 [Pseudonocardia kujensis]|uniref:hypothetical protein n=1 Tax=Pseudonocardia kujensis TaxID=1128675 RepID=UPI001E446E57|nr:hypothetical protein [Pseudonocardia kujensis]MCE0765685.1 hypothetical protein [Pseudonocardia kujensis]
MDAVDALRRRLPWLLWAIPAAGLLAALVLVLAGAYTAAGVVAAAALLMVEPLRRITVAYLPLDLDDDELAEIREVKLRQGEVAAIHRLRELRPATGLGAAARRVRDL